MKMLPWIRKEWNALTDEQQSRLKEKSIKIVKHINNPTVIKVALNTMGSLFEEFPFLASDVYPAYETLRAMSFNNVGYSDVECLHGYFQQFAKASLRVVTEVEPKINNDIPSVICSVGSKLLAHNDAYGDVVVEVMSITESSYIVRCIENRKLLIARWRIPKDSPRIIQYNVE